MWVIFDAVLPAGGRAARLGGVDKPGLDVGTSTLLDRAVSAVASAQTVVVVGPPRAGHAWPREVIAAREDPPYGGPVAAIAAGLDALTARGSTSEIVVVLATDLPDITAEAVDALVERLHAHPDLAVALAVDAGGAEQYLVAAWRRDALAAAVADAAPGAGVRSLLPTARATVPLTTVDDVDTAADLAAARSRSRTTIAQARAAIAAAVSPAPVRTVTVTGDRPVGAVLAADMIAAQAFPTFDTSAMDGWAVSGDGPWRIVDGVVLAGAGSAALDPGCAVRIATGARVPAGATSVLRDEFASPAAELLTRRPDSPMRSDVRRRGEDWDAGESLAPAGSDVGVAAWSVAHSAGVATLEIRGPVTASVLLTGAEVLTAPSGDTAERGAHIRDSIGPIAPDLLRSCGFRTGTITHLTDDETAFDDEFATPRSPVLVVVGATGGGAADRLRAALVRRGASIVVSGVSCRPGGSAVVAVLADGTVVLGLPGNPYAAVATLLTIGPSIARALTGVPVGDPVLGEVIGAPTVAGTATMLVPVRRDGSRWRAVSGVRTPHLRSLLGAAAIAVLPPGTVDGDRVELLPLP